MKIASVARATSEKDPEHAVLELQVHEDVQHQERLACGDEQRDHDDPSSEVDPGQRHGESGQREQPEPDQQILP